MLNPFIKKSTQSCCQVLMILLLVVAHYQVTIAATSISLLDAEADERNAASDSTLPKHNEDLPLDPARQISFTTTEGTWMSLDISPDGSTIVFDLMGDLYTMPIDGGKAMPLTQGMAFDAHPTYSPDGSKILFMSDRSGSENAWILDVETSETTQMTQSNDEGMINGDWSPNGDLFVVAKGRRNFKLHIMHRDGGQGCPRFGMPKRLFATKKCSKDVRESMVCCHRQATQETKTLFTLKNDGVTRHSVGNGNRSFGT